MREVRVTGQDCSRDIYDGFHVPKAILSSKGIYNGFHVPKAARVFSNGDKYAALNRLLRQLTPKAVLTLTVTYTNPTHLIS